MLQTIRERTQGWIAGVIIGIIILTFALWGIHSYFVGGGNNNVVAEVDGIDITREQLTVAYERVRRQMQTQYGAASSITTKDDAALKDRALKALIDIEVLKQASNAQGFQISDDQIDHYLQSMPEFQVDGQFSNERFQEALASTFLNAGEFLDLIKTSMLIDQPKLGIIFTSFALPDETNYTIALVNQERDFEYINIPSQYFLAQPIVISPEKIEAYYKQHKSEFMTPEQVNVEYLELSLNDLVNTIHPVETTLKNFYNENINSYTQPMTWKLADIEVPFAPGASKEDIEQVKKKADAIVQSLKNGTSFDKAAQGQTQTLAGKDWMTLNQVPVELQKAVGNLIKPGQFSSEPVKTDKGFVIVSAVDIKEPKVQAFEEVKEKVKEAYIRQHAEEKFAEMREQLADLTYSDQLETAAKNLNLPVKTSELFTKDKPGKDVSQYKKVRDTAFTNDVLNLQNNSDVIQLNPETVIVLRVKSHIASTLLPLTSTAKQIGEKLQAVEAENRAEKLVNEIKAKLDAGASPQTAATQLKLSWQKSGFIGRYSNKVDSAILDLAFRLPNPANTPTGMVYGTTRLPNGYALVALKAVRSGKVADAKQLAVFAEQVQNSEGLLEYELYKQSQTKQAKIKVG